MISFLMRRLAVAVFLFLIGSTSAVAQQSGIKWYNDLRKASKAAQEFNKPLMIEFWADWCAPCKIMEKEVYTDSRVASALNQKMVSVRIHFDLQKDLVRQYNVEAIPYILFTNSYGGEMLRHRGILEAEDLAAAIEALPADVSDFNRLDRVLEKDKNNFEALREMASRLRDVGLNQMSNVFYDKAIKRDQAKKDPGLREAILYEMGLNFVEMNDGKQAVAVFERCLKEFPNSENREKFTQELVRAKQLLSEL